MTKVEAKLKEEIKTLKTTVKEQQEVIDIFNQEEDPRLGDIVEDEVTKFKGTAMARTKWLFGCNRITIQPLATKPKDGNLEVPGMEVFDQPQVKTVKKTQVGIEPKAKKKRKGPGGPIETPKQKAMTGMR